MDKSQFTVQLLEKIGGPLMASINHVTVTEDVEAAQVMAQLLGQATQISTMLYNTLEIKEADDQADSTRLGLAALVAPLIADAYVQHKKIPTEDHINQLKKSLEAVISFGANFTPASDHQSRLQTIDHKAILFDKDQPILVTLQAMVPVINAVEEFPFGQGKRKLVQDIAGKLEAYASDIATKNGAPDKLKELIIFKALADLYTSCHVAEIQRMSSKSEAERGELSLDPVWEAFQTKLSMVEAFMGFEKEGVPDKKPADTSKGGALKPEEKVEDKPQESAAAPAAGPMGFFKTPSKENGDTAKPDAASIASASPAPEEKKSEGAAAAASSTDAPAAGPMGFFKPGTKTEESDGA